MQFLSIYLNLTNYCIPHILTVKCVKDKQPISMTSEFLIIMYLFFWVGEEVHSAWKMTYKLSEVKYYSWRKHVIFKYLQVFQLFKETLKKSMCIIYEWNLKTSTNVTKYKSKYLDIGTVIIYCIITVYWSLYKLQIPI